MSFPDVANLLAWQFALYGACWIGLGSVLRVSRASVLAWGGSMVAYGAAFALAATRGSGPDWIGFTLSSSAFVIAALLLQIGVDRFVGHHRPDPISVAIVASAIAVYLLLLATGGNGAVHAATSYAATATLGVRTIQRGYEPITAEFGRRVSVAVAGVAGLKIVPTSALLVRQLAVWPDANGIDRAGSQTLVAVVVLMAGGLFNFGFMLLFVLRLLNRFRRQTLEDPLTGLPNRRSLDLELDRVLDDLRDNRRAFALFAVDVDHFKKVNDLLGHTAGDSVLEQLGDRLTATLGGDGFAARIGGEEFVVIVDGTAHAAETGEEIRRSVAAAPFEVDGFPLHITVSVGVATATPDMADPTDVFRRADAALYCAKQRGRNRVEVERRLTMRPIARARTATVLG